MENEIKNSKRHTAARRGSARGGGLEKAVAPGASRCAGFGAAEGNYAPNCKSARCKG